MRGDAEYGDDYAQGFVRSRALLIEESNTLTRRFGPRPRDRLAPKGEVRGWGAESFPLVCCVWSASPRDALALARKSGSQRELKSDKTTRFAARSRRCSPP